MTRQRKTPVQNAGSGITSGITNIEGKVTETVTTKTQSAERVVIMEAGSQSKKSIRRLKEGTGRLMREVNDIVQEARESATTPGGSVVPIVIVYREKQARRNGLGLPIPSPLDLFR